VQIPNAHEPRPARGDHFSWGGLSNA
jgi:hypothetical protein